MDVHHHSHSARKKWTHYFWEFLMLFLAVFCGFMAENEREHMIEHRREKEYMRSLIEDLQTDTVNLNSSILFGQGVSSRLKNLVSFLNSGFSNDSVAQLYRLTNQVGRVVDINFEDRTSSQLKNGGNMRLIRNKTVADSIRNYWGDIKIMENISLRLEELRTKAADIQAQIFHNKYIELSDPTDPIRSDISISPDAKLINNDPELLALYSNRRQLLLNVLSNYLRAMKYVNSKAIRLVTFIKKEYHLE